MDTNCASWFRLFSSSSGNRILQLEGGTITIQSSSTLIVFNPKIVNEISFLFQGVTNGR